MSLLIVVTEGTQIRQIIDHIRIDFEPSHIALTCGLPLHDDGDDALAGEGVTVKSV